MNGKVNDQKSSPDTFKWLIVFGLMIFSIAANYYYSNVSFSVRLAGWLVLIGIVIVIALQTVQGQKAWQLGKDAHAEMRKVTWPTRQETIQTTMIVMLMVVITALILWMVDSILLWAISFLTGQRG